MHPSQRLDLTHSQNFLHDGRLVDRLLRRSSIAADDLVYEIGPGKGIITERLALACRHVVAVEKDPWLARRLQRRFVAQAGVTVVEGDFLAHPLPRTRYKVFASIPFNVTAAIIARLTETPRPPDDAYLVVQAEAARRFIGRPAPTLAAVLLWPWFELGVVHRFQRSDFTPPPGVDVVMMRMRKRGPPLVADADARDFRDFVTYGFTSCRPAAIGPALAGLLGRRRLHDILAATGLTAETRPACVTCEQWLLLFERFRAVTGGIVPPPIRGAERRLHRRHARLHKVHRTRVAHRPRRPWL